MSFKKPVVNKVFCGSTTYLHTSTNPGQRGKKDATKSVRQLQTN